MEKLTDIEYLREAFIVARDFSNDANTQTGAIIVNQEGIIISRGANEIWGLGNPSIKLSAPEKYEKLFHAEVTAIKKAQLKNYDLNGTTLYATWTPCQGCFDSSLEAGITRIVVPECTTEWYAERNKNKTSKDWTESIEEAKQKAIEQKVQYDIITQPIGGVEILFKDIYRTP